MVLPVLISQGTPILFSIMFVPIDIPTNSVWKFPFLCSLTSICSLSLSLIIAILTGMRWLLVVILMGFSLMISHYWAPFNVPVGHLCVLLGKMFIQVLCPFLSWVIWFFVIELYEFLFLCWLLTSNWTCGLQTFSPILYVAFLLCWRFPSLCRSHLVWCSVACLFLLGL